MQDQTSCADDLRATTHSEDTETEVAVLRELFTLGHLITLEELIRHFAAFRTAATEFSRRDEIERAVRDLAASGLVTRTSDDLVLPTRAAHKFAELAEFP